MKHLRPLRLLSFCFCLVLLSGLPSCDSPRDDETLVVGMELTYPPFEMTDAEGRPDGISVRLAEALGRYLNKPVEIRDIGWEGIIPALQTGKVDLIISSMTKTPEREKTIAFSDPYVTNSLCALVAKDSALRSPADLQSSGLRIAVKAATTGETFVEMHLQEAEIVRLTDAASCVLQVIQGKADAFIYDQISIYQSSLEHADKTRAILEPLREESWAIGLRKGDDDLRRRINAFLTEFREAKGFDALADRYMADQKKAFESLGVPFIFH